MYRYLICSALMAAPALAEDVDYDYEGVAHTGYFAAAENPRGLVLIAHDWDGLTDYEKMRADELAGMGYDAFAIDMFGADSPAESMDERRAATGELYQDREKMRALIAAGVQAAQGMSDAQSMVMAGYCFGGGVLLEAARSDMASDFAGFASFHGSYETPEGQSYAEGAGPILILHGAADQVATTEQLVALMGELDDAGIAYTSEIYSGARHAFSVEGSDRYQERAATESWEAFTDFLDEEIGA
ncbi:Dienelactone hydrolase family protein [Rhodobacteraceae bacterium THAF1]|uniref:dienelactone hydrolase family protein n=1 Tax=Palleronia sp. THAF1 TaxID=2587842 RepID=UPI000F3E88BE|nr:dienelactone hydrolase family protein [Palleronia sp. THAF1]QFU09814.1 Dienelactone hydrolase family protein [Palleronia sp. THAF1]VDC17283.1 Dienelactone hydrolase family protein [Rhodobacteraceae bacterium THAF1]